MTAADNLERSYRRWLLWYPRSFRRVHEEEILAVLLAGAMDGQRRPDLPDCLDLVRSALWLRLRPCAPMSNRSVYRVITLLGIGAVVELVAVITIAGTMGDVHANLVERNPTFSASQWHGVVVSQLEPNVIGGALAILFWLFVAWSIGRGHRWGRVAFALFFGLNLYGLFTGLQEGAGMYSRPDLAMGIIVCLVEFVATVAIVRLKTVVSRPDTGPAVPWG